MGEEKMTALAVPIFDFPEPIIREPIKRAALEAAITTAMKRSRTGCEPFVGIIIERVAPNSSDEANWAVKGIKFGKSEREECNSALALIVERMKREFEFADD
jgi:hypothetical protein